MGAYIIVFFFSLIISLAATPVIKKLALSINAVDIPNDRRINKVPIPTLGGIAIYLGFMGAMFINTSINSLTMGIFIGGTFILLVGILDDLYELSARVSWLADTGCCYPDSV